jgi:uridylate kinase
MKNDIYVISLGGSLIIPEEIDIDFLRDFKNLILSQVEKGAKFVIITGGGKITRKYQNASKILATPSNADLDWIGIASLKLNAEFMRVIFNEHANSEIVTNLAEHFTFEKSIVIGSAYTPGQSTDYNAVLAAYTIGASKVINLSNTDYVYDADPRSNPEAKKIENISWAEYRKLIPTEWNPGLNSPFDPIASAFAERENITVYTMNGKNIDNLSNVLNGQPFLGTTIQ